MPLPLDSVGNNANASDEGAVTAAVSFGAHIFLASSLVSLIDPEASIASSSAEQEEASAASSLPQLPPIDATTDENSGGEGVASVSCDFTNVDSVNEFYPVQDGKSKKQINVFTLNKLNKLETVDQKDHFCRRWRMCESTSDHAALMTELNDELAAQEAKEPASHAVDDAASMRSPPSPVSGDVVVDYNDKNSVNKFYPPQKGKETRMIPKGTLKLLDTDAAKHNFCLKWRKCKTKAEQNALRGRVEEDAKEKKRVAKVAKERDQRMKKKREDEEKVERKHKKREESAAKERESALRRNANKRQKTTDAKKEQQENIVSFGITSVALFHHCISNM